MKGFVSIIDIRPQSVTGNWDVGGLVGINWAGTVSDSYATTTVNSGWSVGGLVGFNDGDSTIENSYSAGTVTGRNWVGGLAGGSDGTVKDSYCTGTVIGETSVGGLVGRLWFGGTVVNSFSVGKVTGSGSYVGGLVGSRTAPGGDLGIVIDSFWDIEASGQPTSAGGVGKTTSQMKSILTFSNAPWSITTVASRDARNTSYLWNIVDGETYPFLSWEPVP